MQLNVLLNQFIEIVLELGGNNRFAALSHYFVRLQSVDLAAQLGSDDPHVLFKMVLVLFQVNVFVLKLLELVGVHLV